MGKNMKSRVRLGFGETEWHKVKRGVAQGAVESPWLYSCFIDGLADELRKRDLGVMVDGVRVPLLMYADDIVMLASTVSELRAMNDVASEYAYKHRFRHNGDKSAVMAFNANKELSYRVARERWVLSGEKVEVKAEYKYLGADILRDTTDWRTHINRLIKKAGNRSRDLLWICRKDKGIRPRSAATLWKSIVRPVLEYAAELWSGDIPKSLADKAEQVQTDFARGVLGLQGQRAISNDFVRTEMGLEKLAARWEKLRLGYWRKIQAARPGRLLTKVARMRMGQVRWGMSRLGELSWMKGTRSLLTSRGLARYWYDPARAKAKTKERWKKLVYLQVEEHFEQERDKRSRGLVSLARYNSIKHWGPMDTDRAQFVGEVGRHGALVVERYLDDVKDGLGRQLKLMCRADCLPVLSRVTWELGISVFNAKCMMCNTGHTEDVKHLLLQCPAYQRQRERMMETAERAFAGAGFSDLSESERVCALLGARAGSCAAEDRVDVMVKRFLRKAWKIRGRVTRAVNDEFGRQDLVWAKGGGWSNPTPKICKKDNGKGKKAGKERGFAAKAIHVTQDEGERQAKLPVRRRLFT